MGNRSADGFGWRYLNKIDSNMTIKEQVIQIVAESLELDANVLDCDMELFDMEGYDSMRSVMILAKIEDTFDVMVPEEDIFDITTINEWVAEIEKIKE